VDDLAASLDPSRGEVRVDPGERVGLGGDLCSIDCCDLGLRLRRLVGDQRTAGV
jgi:hypothetical protein